MSGCVFCRIARGEEEAQMVHDEEGVMAFHSKGGKAPVHVIVIPKEHVTSLAEAGRLPEAVAKRIFEVAREVAEKVGISESGYVFRINTGPDAGQEVFHMHAHVMGGERMEM